MNALTFGVEEVTESWLGRCHGLISRPRDGSPGTPRAFIHHAGPLIESIRSPGGSREQSGQALAHHGLAWPPSGS